MWVWYSYSDIIFYHKLGRLNRQIFFAQFLDPEKLSKIHVMNGFRAIICGPKIGQKIMRQNAIFRHTNHKLVFAT